MGKLDGFANSVAVRFFQGITFFLLLVLAAGCGGKNSGNLVLDRELDKTFTDYQVLPDHRYYVTGGYEAPAAILAIHNDYQLDNEANLWVPVPDVDGEQMRRWVDNLAPEVGFWSGPEFMAHSILDPEQKRVGAWYSGQRFTRIQFSEGNMIRVYPPDLKPSVGGEGRLKRIMP